jgi:arylsulfatase
MAIHAAMIDRMDREIGRVLEQLRRMQAWDNTFICFLSDNGASAEIMVRGDGHDPQAALGSADTYLCLGPGFSSAANTPFRRHKTWVHEGGISTPLIVHWPAGLASKNELRHTPAHVIDLAPTLVDLAGGTLDVPAGAPACPGRSLKPLFGQETGTLHEALWFYHEGNMALRQGDWKIVSSNSSRPFPWNTSAEAKNADVSQVAWELYDLSKDRAEQRNLAATYPQRVADMARLWVDMRDQFLRDAGVNQAN